MITLRDIMSTDLETLRPGESLRRAADLFTSEHITGAPVLEGDRTVGVLSVTDVLEFRVDRASVPAAGRERAEWGDPESPETRYWTGEDSPATYFTDYWSDAGMDLVDRFEEANVQERDLLGEHTVGEAMTRGLVALPPDTPVSEAARYLLEQEVHRVLVMEEDRLLGVVSTTDLVRAVAEHGLDDD